MVPNCYTYTVHMLALQACKDSFYLMANGPCYDEYMQKLELECLENWESNQQCDSVSVTGRHCIKALHGTPDVHLDSNNHEKDVII